MDVLTEVRKLNFPVEQFIVVGAGIMAVKGIRDTKDLDLVVSIELFEKCKQEGWEVCAWTKTHLEGKEWLRKGIVELYDQISTKKEGIPLKSLLRDVEYIEDIPFLKLERLIDFKRDYGRPKDLDDIVVIQKYLDTQKVQEQ